MPYLDNSRVLYRAPHWQIWSALILLRIWNLNPTFPWNPWFPMSSAGMIVCSVCSTSISEPSQSTSLSASAVSFRTVMHRAFWRNIFLIETDFSEKKCWKWLKWLRKNLLKFNFKTGTSMLKSRPGDLEFLQTLMLSAQRIVYLVYLCWCLQCRVGSIVCRDVQFIHAWQTDVMFCAFWDGFHAFKENLDKHWHWTVLSNAMKCLTTILLRHCRLHSLWKLYQVL